MAAAQQRLSLNACDYQTLLQSGAKEVVSGPSLVTCHLQTERTNELTPLSFRCLSQLISCTKEICHRAPALKLGTLKADHRSAVFVVNISYIELSTLFINDDGCW